MTDFTKFVLSSDGVDPLTLVPASPTGGVILGDVDIGFAAVRENIRPRALQSGVIDRSVWHGSSTVTASFVGFDTATTRRMVSFATSGRRTVLTFRRAGDTSDRRMSLVGRAPAVPQTVASQGRVSGVVQWSCPDGIVESASLHTSVAAIGPAATDGGLTWPLTWPLDYGFASGPATLDAVNMGDLPAWPVLRVDGPVDGISLSNDTTGQHLTVGYDLPAGQYFEVVMRDRAVYLNGLPSASLLEWLQTPADWWQLWPGRSTIRLSALTSAQPAKVTAAWRDAYSW